MARAPLPPPPFCAPRNGQLGTGGGQACHYTHSQTTITLFHFYLGRELAIFAFIETFILFSISTGYRGTGIALCYLPILILELKLISLETNE